ncbi:MAG: ABC transporter ATP-binding protein [Opitutales bacterium]
MNPAAPEIYVRANRIGKDYPIQQAPSSYLFKRIRNAFSGEDKATKSDHIHRAIKEISFDLTRGDALGIIGKNGSGKSTLLQLITGTLNPTRGTIETKGRIASILELGVGFHPDFSGRENAIMQLAMMGIDRPVAESKLQDIEAFAEIGKFFEEPIKTYSSGMLVRLAFAVIAHSDPEILIVDEALAVGDAQFVQKCLRFINNFRESGILLFVSHETATVRSYCDRAIWLEDGDIRMEGESNTVTEAYIEALFTRNNERHNADSDVTEESIEIHRRSYKDPTTLLAARQASPIDPRNELLKNSTLRNDLKIEPFASSTLNGFGTGGAEIRSVFFKHDNGNPLSWITGGELVHLEIHVACFQQLDSPIIGFLIRNDVGLEIFGDNTYLTSKMENGHRANAEDTLVANFSFYMPILPKGDYTITCAIANGDERKHIQHHWVHDAISFCSTSDSMSTGLVGIPMQKISVSSLVASKQA